MQSQKALELILFWTLFIALSTSSQARALDSFAEAIAKAKAQKVHEFYEPGQGLPYFVKNTLSPRWNLENKGNVVSIPSLELTDHHGSARTQSLFQDKVSFLAFIFTTCSGFCPDLVANMKEVSQKNPGHNVQFVLFTVDPEHDSPEKLLAYAKKMKFDSRWILLTGSRETIYGLAKDVLKSNAFQRLNVKERNFAHSEHFYVIDQKGFLRAVLNGTRLDVPTESQAVVKSLN